MAESKIIRQPGMDFDYLHFTNLSTTSGTALTIKTYNRKVLGVMRGYVGGTGSYDRTGEFCIDNGNKVVYYPQSTQSSVTLDCVVALQK